MKNKKLIGYFPPFLIIISFSLLVISGLKIKGVLADKHMDLFTFVSSLSTPQVSVNELQSGKLKPVILVDVRSQKEYDRDRIGNSILIPLNDIESGAAIQKIRDIVAMNTHPDRKMPTIVLYCKVGGDRSFNAYKALEKTGLNFVVLSGGIKGWREAVPAKNDATVLAPITPLAN